MEPDLPELNSLAELAEEVRAHGRALYLRWSKGPGADRDAVSRDELTGVPLPGLSASPMAVEDWWAGRPLDLWVARRLHDYHHLRERRGPGVRPWLLVGAEVGRGPDNEPLVRCDRPVAWVAEEVLARAAELLDRQDAEWGPLDRSGHQPTAD